MYVQGVGCWQPLLFGQYFLQQKKKLSSINAWKSPRDQEMAKLLLAALNHGMSWGVHWQNKVFSRLCGGDGAALTEWWLLFLFGLWHVTIISHPDAHQQCSNNAHCSDIIVIVAEKWKQTRGLDISIGQQGFTSTLKYTIFQIFHLSTLNSNTVCSYIGFSLQIYAPVWTTLLPSAVNLVQKKKNKLISPDCTVNLKKKSCH